MDRQVDRRAGIEQAGVMMMVSLSTTAGIVLRYV